MIVSGPQRKRPFTSTSPLPTSSDSDPSTGIATLIRQLDPSRYHRNANCPNAD